MADTQSGGRDGGRDGGHGGRRSGKHDGGRSGERNGKRKSRRNGEARERNESGGANNPPDDLDDEEEISLPGHPVTPLLASQQMRNGERYSALEGVPGYGWSFAGLNEPISDNGGPEHTGPILVAQHPGNNGLVQGGQLIGLEALPRYSPLNAWTSHVSRESNVSMECDPVTDFLFDFDPNGGSPDRNA